LDVLGWTSKADSSGRTGRSIEDVHETSEKCFQIFELLGARGIEPIVKGRELIARGIKPGPAFKAILNEAYELQIEGMNDVNEILEKLNC